MIFKKRTNRGFTLLEVLCVIAIIGILSSILIPSIGMAKKSSLSAKSKAQFHQYIFALEAYFHEYGQYPYFFYEKPSINLREYSCEFVKALSAHGPYPEYEELSSFETQKLNPKHISFYHFSEWEFDGEGKLRDAFENIDIFVSIDIEERGLLTINNKPVAAKIAVYTQNSDGGVYEEIKSWR